VAVMTEYDIDQGCVSDAVNRQPETNNALYKTM